ncbi:MAG: SIS domain-containing protein [Nocardioides sp.]
MDVKIFLDDVEAKPALLRAFADRLADGLAPDLDFARITSVALTGLGSSRYAALDAARELRRHGVRAWCDYSGAPLGPDDEASLVVAVSASGTTPETVAAAQSSERCQVLAISNVASSPLAEAADATMVVEAGPESSGAVTASMIHTSLALAVLSDELTGRRRNHRATAQRAADAIEHLLQSRERWLPEALNLMNSSDGVNFVASNHRSASSSQSALLTRELARRHATGCDSADWAHVDVYLTKSTDYRLVLLGANPHSREIFQWTSGRGSKVLAWGHTDSRADMSVRFPHDSDPDVAPLVDTVLAELVGHRLLYRSPEGSQAPDPV